MPSSKGVETENFREGDRAQEKNIVKGGPLGAPVATELAQLPSPSVWRLKPAQGQRSPQGSMCCCFWLRVCCLGTGLGVVLFFNFPDSKWPASALTPED